MASDLSQSSCLSLGFEEDEDIALSNRTLDVADNGSVGLIHKLDADLSDTTARASSAEQFDDSGHALLTLLLDANSALSFNLFFTLTLNRK